MTDKLPEESYYRWGVNCEAWYLLKSATLDVIRERMPPGTSEELHSHRFSQQVFYILSGTATVEMNGAMLTMVANESIHVKPGTLHRIKNEELSDLNFILVSEPPSHHDRIDIIGYQDDLKSEIKKLNVEWLEKYFRVEPNDEIQLSNPQAEIIDKGGWIFYARTHGEITGTASLLRIDDQTYELGKMAVTSSAQGLGIGKLLMDHCIQEAKKKGIKKLLLYSNTALAPAIQLYRKYGFVEVPMETGHYERANIKMERSV